MAAAATASTAMPRKSAGHWIAPAVSVTNRGHGLGQAIGRERRDGPGRVRRHPVVLVVTDGGRRPRPISAMRGQDLLAGDDLRLLAGGEQVVDPLAVRRVPGLEADLVAPPDQPARRSAPARGRRPAWSGRRRRRRGGRP